MSDKMELINLDHLISWMFEEYLRTKSIFGIRENTFYVPNKNNSISLFGENSDNPIGPAAGPHTQLSQNIIASFLTGARFFELKTVQKYDRLEIEKPCIDVNDEGYNIEWSQELLLEESYDEYLKSWLLLPLLDELFICKSKPSSNYFFNMSVGYNLSGIKSKRMNLFINKIKDTSIDKLSSQYKSFLIDSIKNGYLKDILTNEFELDQYRMIKLVKRIESIPSQISNSVTLSTMHGCPPKEIEAITKYLIKEKEMHTYIKLNPTLIGQQTVRAILDTNGYDYVPLVESTFENDLKFSDAIQMLERLMEFAANNKKEFGVKLSNTLGVVNKKKVLKGSKMYLSGRALFPLTIHLAKILIEKLPNLKNISFSGGATAANISDILGCGIFPVTVATDILKPGGLNRLTEMCKTFENINNQLREEINLDKIEQLCQKSLNEEIYKKYYREVDSIKVESQLPMFDCYIAPCQVACPIHQDVAEYVTLIEQGRLEEAIKVITDKNPLPNITGYICDHQCMNHCTRWDYDTTVQIREMKKVAAQSALNNFTKQFKDQKFLKQNSSKVAIIGAGPSGLTSAYFLARAGLDVTIFERNDKPGGVAQYSIPRFRLPQESVDADIDFIKQFGVKFNLNSDSYFSINKMNQDGFKYVHVAIGASVSDPLKLDGMDKPTLSAIDFLEDYNKGLKPLLGKNVAVIGAGNSAMDASRAAGRIDGVDNVFIVYRRTIEFMPADKEEIEGAIDDGAIIKELLQPVSYSDGKLKCQVMKLGIVEKDGRKRAIPVVGKFLELKIDTVISAIGEKVEYPLLESNKLLDEAKKMDKTKLETKHQNVFIGGDALRGPGNLIDAVADGKKIAEEIIKREELTKNINEDYSALFEDKYISEKLDSEKGKFLPTTKISKDEAFRCLTCNIECNKCVEVCPNRANITLPSPAGFKDKYQIIHIDGMCNECGNCETFCPHQGKPYIQKTTIFWSENDFLNSKNDGFFVLSDKEPVHLLIRFDGNENEITIEKMNELKEDLYHNNTPSTGFNKFIRNVISILEDYSYMIKVSPKYYRKDVLKW